MGFLFSKSNQAQIPNNNIRNEINEKVPVIDNKELQKKEEENFLCLKIYLCGSGKGRDYLLDNAFKDYIKDPFLQKKAHKEFKTDQFHWILSNYSSVILNNDVFKKIIAEIEKDKNEKENENNKKILKQQIIICFGEENAKRLEHYFKEMRKPRIIFVTESKCEIEIDKRYVTNIVTQDLEESHINSLIISTLWEFDCYFNSRGNMLCRYTPENIFKGFEKDNSLFSINILLVGKSRTGKSSLINLIAGKMIALETDDNVSVTNNITEYYIYRNDNKEAQGAIKLIDTPGIVPFNNEKNYKKKEEIIMNMIKNNKNEKKLEKQIHFILFILMKDDLSIEGDNITELFENLKDCNIPVYFIINKTDDHDDEDINEKRESINEELGEDYNELLNENNFINVNLKKGEIEKVHGISKIFKKISEYLTNNKILNENLKSKIDKLLDGFRKIEKKDIFLSEKEEDKIKINELKKAINFDEGMKEIKDICKTNVFFSKVIDYNQIIEYGKTFAENCKKTILSLSKLKGILPSVSKDLPLISILQGYMVKEIEEGFGLNVNSLNYGLKFLKNNLNDLFEKKVLDDEKKGENNDYDILNEDRLDDWFDIIEKKIQDFITKSNKKLIFQLANLINKLGEYLKENQIKNIINFNEEYSDFIEQFCIFFFEKEIVESEGLTFIINYYNKLNSLLEDINYYANKEDWDSFKMEIKNKEIN